MLSRLSQEEPINFLWTWPFPSPLWIHLPFIVLQEQRNGGYKSSALTLPVSQAPNPAAASHWLTRVVIRSVGWVDKTSRVKYKERSLTLTLHYETLTLHKQPAFFVEEEGWLIDSVLSVSSVRCSPWPLPSPSNPVTFTRVKMVATGLCKNFANWNACCTLLGGDDRWMLQLVKLDYFSFRWEADSCLDQMHVYFYRNQV